MRITYVTESHAWGDDKCPIDIPLMSDHDEHTNWLKDHEGKIDELYEKIRENKNAHNQRMDNIDGWIGKIAKRVEEMPQTVRTVFEQVLRETFDDRLKCFEEQVKVLREERKQISAQLEELRRERNESRSKLLELRSQCEDSRAQLEKLNMQLAEARTIAKEVKDDFSKRVAEFKMAVPVPKKFAKFLFLKVEPDAKKED